MLRRIDPWLGAVLAVSAALCLFHLGWGLPNGNDSWAADSMGPLTVLNVGRRQLASFDSGWFWFKYPFGYPLLLLAAYAPYFAFLFLSGQFAHPTATYPYGLENPEAVLYHLAIVSRFVNVGLVLGTVAFTYGIGARLLGRRTGLLAAWFTATAYPLVYYAHTSNQDAAYLFWLTAALWATVACTREDAAWPYRMLGIAAGMSMATKEQGFALLFGLAVVLVVDGIRRGDRTDSWLRRAGAVAFQRRTVEGAVIAIVVWLVAGNAILNPSGFLNRLRDLTGHPVAGLSSRVTPVKFALFKGFAKEWGYAQDFVDVVSSTFGVPLFVVAMAGIVYLVWRRRHAAICLLVPLAFYGFVSLRTHHVLVLRYTLPVVPILAVAAAGLCLAAVRNRIPVAIAATVLLATMSFARAVELDLLLRGDPRYAAEAWLQENVPRGSSVETYQKKVYMPRMPGLEAREVPLEERSVAALLERAPRAIVLSTASRKTITRFWTKDWRQPGAELLTEVPEAAEMLRALEAGELPYRETVRFGRAPWLLRLRITSVAPTIRVFERTT